MEEIKMTTINKLIQEIKNLDGATVSVFGQPTTLDASPDKGYVHIIDILEKFQGNECEMEMEEHIEVNYLEGTEEWVVHVGSNILQDGFETEEEAEEYRDEQEPETEHTEDTEEYLIYIAERYGLKEIEHSNSYNWSGLVSHHFDFQIMENMTFNEILIEFKINMYGDVRANYTDTILLKFNSVHEFYELIGECDKMEKIGEYDVRVSAMRDTFEVFDENGNQLDENFSDWEELEEHINSLEKIECITVQLSEQDGYTALTVWKEVEILDDEEASKVEHDFYIWNNRMDFENVKDVLEEHGFMPEMNEYVQIGDETVIEEVLEILE
jgi:hypothetical protein